MTSPIHNISHVEEVKLKFNLLVEIPQIELELEPLEA